MKQFSIRLFVFLLGILILALGVVLCAKVNLGVAPYDSLILNITAAFNVSYSVANISAGLFMLFLQVLLLRKRFPLPSLIQVVFLVYISVVFDFFLYQVFAFAFPQSLVFRGMIFILGMLCLSLGIGMFLSAKFYSFPLETLMAICDKEYHISLKISKWSIDSICFVISLLLVFLVPLEVSNIGIGTIVMLIAVGPLIAYFHSASCRIVDRMCKR